MAKPRAAMLAARRLLRGDREPLNAHVETQSEAFAPAVRSPEAKKTFTAFLGKGEVGPCLSDLAGAVSEPAGSVLGESLYHLDIDRTSFPFFRNP